MNKEFKRMQELAGVSLNEQMEDAVKKWLDGYLKGTVLTSKDDIEKYGSLDDPKKVKYVVDGGFKTGMLDVKYSYDKEFMHIPLKDIQDLAKKIGVKDSDSYKVEDAVKDALKKKGFKQKLGFTFGQTDLKVGEMMSQFFRDPNLNKTNESESLNEHYVAGGMDNFNLKGYLSENRLLKEVTFADVKAAAEKKPGYEGEEGEDGFSIPYEFGTINMYNRPSGGDGTGDVGIEYESGGTTQETGFISYGKAKYIVQKSLAEGDSDEEELSVGSMKKLKGWDLNEQSSDMIKSKVEAAVDGLTKKIKSTINSEKSAQEISEIFKSVTFRMGQLLESYATYTQRIQQSNDSDDSSEEIADAEDALDISFKKIETDVMGRLK